MPYPKLKDLKAGDALIADGGFTCMEKGKEYVVKEATTGLFVECEEGEHYLIGQRNHAGECVGFELKD